MATQHNDPTREPTDTRSEVLSDATDLDALLEAILGNEIAPDTPHRRPPADVTVPSVVAAARPEPTVAPSPPTGVNSEGEFNRATADDNDAWGFVSEDPQEPSEIAREFSAAPRPTPTSLAPSLSPPTWRDDLRVSWSKQSLLVAVLFAAALITAGAIGLRDQLTATQTLPTSPSPASFQSSSVVQATSADTPADAPVVKVWAAARDSGRAAASHQSDTAAPRKRRNESTVERTSTAAIRRSGAQRTVRIASGRVSCAYRTS